MTKYLIFSLLVSLAFKGHMSGNFAGEIPINKEYAYSLNTDTINQSVLNSGTWYKIKVYEDGIYKLSYDDITGMGFNNPTDIRIYGNGGSMLPLMNSESRPYDLVECAIYMHYGADGVFNQGDFILFYGKGPLRYGLNHSNGLFEHEIHGFSMASYYFVTTGKGPGKKVIDKEPPEGNPAVFVDTYNDFFFHDVNRYNFLKSGRQWFGQKINYSAYDTLLVFPDRDVNSPVYLKANVVSRSANAKAFTFKSGGQQLGSIVLNAVNLSNTTGVYANQKSDIFTFSPQNENINLNISYNLSSSSDEGYIDYYTINTRRNLVINSDAFFFRDKESAGEGIIAQFELQNGLPNTMIWELSPDGDIYKMDAIISGTDIMFKAYVDDITEYVAVNPLGNFPKPVINGQNSDTGNVPNQNLHGYGPHQMLIVTHPLFKAAADSLAEYRRTNDNMSVLVVTTDEVYNEFSSGAADVSAIRDFARMLFLRYRNDPDSLRYLLLFGDGSYNNISNKNGNPNFIPTYQSESSLNASTSYVSDDFFGLLEDNEGGAEVMEAFSLDIGIGRLPAKTADEAMVLFRKIKMYHSEKEKPEWRNNILFVGDDEDGNLHMSQANQLADMVQEENPSYIVKKVLLDAYKQESTSSGARYPDVNRIIYEQFHKGILIFNYTGHGGKRGLSAEQILMREDLDRYTNKSFLPLFVTATCEFSRFDDVAEEGGQILESTSAGETALLNPNGGSIALLSTTRIVYSDRNHFLNTQFYNVVFERDDYGEYYRLGDIIRMTKDSAGNERNKLSFILLGDPSLKLAAPGYNVVTDSINGISVDLPTDTLKAYSTVRISGHIVDIDNNILEDFNGIIYPSVFDKLQTVTSLANDGGEPFQFDLRDNLIFKGKASVTNGRFSFEFNVPRDIKYSYGTGKITYYSKAPEMDAHGFFKDFIIGGTELSPVIDDEGPEIDLYMNDETFNNQGITNNSPVIYAKISDGSGINTTGNGIGHDITGILDDNTSNPIILNDFFESELDDYKSGTLVYPLYDLSEGWHSLKVKVWDIYNNSSEKSIEFRVLPPNIIITAKVMNFPNPAAEYTFFRFEHNRPDEELEVILQVYDLTGKLVYNMEKTVISNGFVSDPIEWDLKDINNNYLRQGVYPYRIIVKDAKGFWTDSYHKLIIGRQ